MSESEAKTRELLLNELELLWKAHENVGLNGYMCLYTNTDQIPFRSKDSGISFWFNRDETGEAIETILKYYNKGRLPNSPLLLNPIIHRKEDDGTYTPLGSGIIWCSALTLGIDVLSELPEERLNGIGVFTGHFGRGGNTRSGIKALAFCDTVQLPEADGKTVACCHEIYEIIDMKSDLYEKSYFLSGISYLTNHGLFEQPDISSLFPQNSVLDEEFIKKSVITVKIIMDTAECWNAYERHHSLYKKFGNNTKNIEKNLKFFNMVARDVTLFDAAGSTRYETESSFDFLVPGLVPRGSITLLAASEGVGKSTIAHQLSIMVTKDYKEGDEPPKWLGQPINLKDCEGVGIYFSGEDSPQIFNARAALLDPDHLAERLIYQRTDFGENVSFSQHIRNLYKIPNVPIVIIDPARKYLGGDENNSGLVNDFFDTVEEFAIQKNAAVIVVHNLQRGSYPNSTREILGYLSGSQAFIDRPRVIIGVYRDEKYTIAGLSKNNIPPNFGMIAEERVFARDPRDLSLVWLAGEEGIRNAPLSRSQLEEIAKKARESGNKN